MKRFWLGIALLLVLLAAGVTTTVIMENRFSPISEKMTRAAEAARTGDMSGAEAALAEAEGLWEQNRNFAASVADHEPMEEIDGLLAAARSLLASGDLIRCAGLCAQVGELTRAMGEAHWLRWWTFL